MRSKKCKRKNLLGRSDRKKVALVSGNKKKKWWSHILFVYRTQINNERCVSGPFIVYMLRDIDILEDWAAIKKVPTKPPAFIPSGESYLQFSCFSGQSSSVPTEEEGRKVEFTSLTTAGSASALRSGDERIRAAIPTKLQLLCLWLKPRRSLVFFKFQRLRPRPAATVCFIC